MRDPSRVRVAGLLESYAEDFRDELAERGYSPDAAAVQLQVMGHLSGWLAGRGLGSTGLTPAVVDAYLAERRSLGGASHWTRRALAPLLGFLQGREVAPAEVPPGPAGPVEALLGRYACWLAAERGLAETTIRRNAELVSEDQDLQVLGAVISAGEDQRAGEHTGGQREQEQHRPMVGSAWSRCECRFPRPTGGPPQVTWRPLCDRFGSCTV
jgi:hypothetical protein